LDKIRFFKVITIIFSLYGYDGLGLGFPRERKNVLFLPYPQDYKPKSQDFCEFEKKVSEKILKSQESCEFDRYPLSKRRNGYEKAI
jgi:hypothetical protein